MEYTQAMKADILQKKNAFMRNVSAQFNQQRYKTSKSSVLEGEKSIELWTEHQKVQHVKITKRLRKRYDF